MIAELKIERIEIPKNRRILVTSDIHGNGSWLKKLLGKVKFGREDMLFILGDLIEKGLESLKTLRYVMELAELENVVVLLGNVDLGRVQMLEDLKEENSGNFYEYLLDRRQKGKISIYDEMAAEIGVRLDTPEKALQHKAFFLEHFQKELDFIRNLPAIAETQNFIFTHSGLPCEDLEEVKARDIFQVLKIDSFMTRGLTFKKYVVAGHWPVSIYNDRVLQTNPIFDTDSHIISIDGGCGLHPEGQLNMLIIPEIDCEIENIRYASWDGFEKFTALTPQKGSMDSINISYMDRKVRILEEGEAFVYAEHLSSGRRLKIPNSHIYSRNGDLADARYTDYLLPVQAGDKLAMVERSSQGCLMKKDGVCGWYMGDLGNKI